MINKSLKESFIVIDQPIKKETIISKTEECQVTTTLMKKICMSQSTMNSTKKKQKQCSSS